MNNHRSHPQRIACLLFPSPLPEPASEALLEVLGAHSLEFGLL